MPRSIKTFSLFLICLICMTTYGDRFKAIHSIVTVVTGTAAVESFGNGLELNDINLKYEKLRRQCLGVKNPVLYSVFFTVKKGLLSKSLWADFDFSGADLFVKVSVDGNSSMIIPEIIRNYEGQQLQLNFVAEEFPPRSQVEVTILDDDSKKDVVWNEILRFRTSFNTEHDIPAFIAMNASGSRSIKIPDAGVEINKPDHIASISFVAPNPDQKYWNADGRLKDQFGLTVGKLQLAKLCSLHNKSRTVFMMFWFMTSLILLGVAIRYLRKVKSI